MKELEFIKGRTVSLILLVISIVFSDLIEINASETEDDIRPKIGLVLSGGGAKGVAHIGVLKVLEEAEIPDRLYKWNEYGGNHRRALFNRIHCCRTRQYGEGTGLDVFAH